MHFHLIFPLLLLTYLKHALSVSVYINSSSHFTFEDRIMKVEITILNGIQFSYILFANGTISKLDNQLNYLDSIKTLDSSKIKDFSICNTNFYSINSPSIIAIVENGLQWKLINLLNTSIQISYNTSYAIVYFYCQGVRASTNKIEQMRAVIYFSDYIQHFQILSGSFFVKFQKNLTQLSSWSTR